jgi:hypothetical protein
MPRKKKELPGPGNQTVTGKKIAYVKKKSEGSIQGAENAFIKNFLEPLVVTSCANQIISSREHGRRVIYGRPSFF